jgi:type I restriction enzyme S subunit
VSVPVYGSYRNSGVELLGDVPSHWSSSRVRFAVRLNPSKSEIAHRDRDEDVSFVPMDAVGEGGSLRLDQMRPIGEVETGYTYFRDGDVVVAKITPCFENGKGAIMRGLIGGVGFGTTELIVARPTGQTSAAYIYWLFNSASFRKLGEGSMYGAGGQKRVPDDFVRDFPVALPPPAEQAAISAFLDRETGKIDALVEEQRRLIELLKEKRQAVISHAVTKGLDPTVPMKVSGVEWLGEVPAHWQVAPIRKVAKLESGHTPSRSRPEWWQDCTIPWFSLADVWQIREAKRDYVFETKEMVSELGLANSSARLLPANTVMLSRTASVGFSAVMGVPMATTQDFANWVCGSRLKPEFLLQVLRAMSGEFRRLMMGSTHNTIYMPDIQSLTMVLPPLDEQEAIVQHVKLLAGRYDELTREAEAAIELLHERRAALISAAVTGKIDVRGLAPSVIEDAYAA